MNVPIRLCKQTGIWKKYETFGMCNNFVCLSCELRWQTVANTITIVHINYALVILRV